jgi:hypothetical protein
MSEVRLARLGGGPVGGRDAATFLDETRTWDVLPYVPSTLAGSLLDSLAAELESRGRTHEAEIVRTKRATLRK